MATQIETGTTTTEVEPAPRQRSKAAGASTAVMLPWLRAQSINVTRHAAALRPFHPEEFGTGAEAPTAGHLQAVNKLITGLRRGLLEMSGKVRKSAVDARQQPPTTPLQESLRRKA